MEWPISKLKVKHTNFTRKYRSNKILKDGEKVQPLAIRPDGTIIDGYQRFLAAKNGNRKTLPVIIINYETL